MIHLYSKQLESKKMTAFEEILEEKEATLISKEAWLKEVGMGKLTSDKLASKRVKVRRDITDLKWMIKELKEIIQEERG